MLAQRGQSSPFPFADLALAWPSPGWGHSVTKVIMQAGPASVSISERRSPLLQPWNSAGVCSTSLERPARRIRMESWVWEAGGSCAVCQVLHCTSPCCPPHLGGLEQQIQSVPCQVPQFGTSLHVGQPHPGLQSCCGVTQLCVLTHTGDSCISSPLLPTECPGVGLLSS